jgi:hypothetical protein
LNELSLALKGLERERYVFDTIKHVEFTHYTYMRETRTYTHAHTHR